MRKSAYCIISLFTNCEYFIWLFVILKLSFLYASKMWKLESIGTEFDSSAVINRTVIIQYLSVYLWIESQISFYYHSAI